MKQTTPDQTSLTGTLETDLNAGNPPAEVMARHDQACLVFSGAWCLMYHYLPVGTAVPEKCLVLTVISVRWFLYEVKDKVHRCRGTVLKVWIDSRKEMEFQNIGLH